MLPPSTSKQQVNPRPWSRKTTGAGSQTPSQATGAVTPFRGVYNVVCHWFLCYLQDCSACGRPHRSHSLPCLPPQHSPWFDASSVTFKAAYIDAGSVLDAASWCSIQAGEFDLTLGTGYTFTAASWLQARLPGHPERNHFNMLITHLYASLP